MARPKKPKGEARSKLMQVRVQIGEYANFRKAAGASGLDVSAWVRERLIQAVRKELRS